MAKREVGEERLYEYGGVSVSWGAVVAEPFARAAARAEKTRVADSFEVTVPMPMSFKGCPFIGRPEVVPMELTINGLHAGRLMNPRLNKDGQVEGELDPSNETLLALHAIDVLEQLFAKTVGASPEDELVLYSDDGSRLRLSAVGAPQDVALFKKLFTS